MKLSIEEFREECDHRDPRAVIYQFWNTMKDLAVVRGKIAELKNDVEHEVQRSEFYKGEHLRRKGNKVALEKFDEFKSKLEVDAVDKVIKKVTSFWSNDIGDTVVRLDDLIEIFGELEAGEL
jgi:hypothetical protein